MRWIAVAAGALILVVAIAGLVGTRLPRNHVASRTMRVKRPPQDVWPVLTNLADASGVPVDVLENKPPNRLVTRVKESEKNFGGTWAMTVDADGGGSRVKIVED